MRSLIRGATRAMIVAVPVMLSACDKPAPPPGPAEQAGKKIDEAMQKAEEAARTAADKTGEALKKAGKELQDASKK